MRAIRAAFIVFAVVGPMTAAAQPASSADLAAKAHSKAGQLSKRGEFAEAAELWREAERLDPHWKYAFNLAFALERLGGA